MDSEWPNCVYWIKPNCNYPQRAPVPSTTTHSQYPPSIWSTTRSYRHRVSLVSRSIWQKNNSTEETHFLPVQFTDLTRFAALGLINSVWPYAAVTLSFCFLVGCCSIHILTVHRMGRQWFESFSGYKINKCFVNRWASLIQKSAAPNPVLHKGPRGKEEVAATAETSSPAVVCRSTAVIPNPRNEPSIQDYLVSAESGLAFQHRLRR